MIIYIYIYAFPVQIGISEFPNQPFVDTEAYPHCTKNKTIELIIPRNSLEYGQDLFFPLRYQESNHGD